MYMRGVGGGQCSNYNRPERQRVGEIVSSLAEREGGFTDEGGRHALADWWKKNACATLTCILEKNFGKKGRE
jgi:hypothetical protein